MDPAEDSDSRTGASVAPGTCLLRSTTLLLVAASLCAACGADGSTSGVTETASARTVIETESTSTVADVSAPGTTVGSITVYEPDEEDDVPDPRHVFQDECASGVAFQSKPGTAELTVNGTTEWEAVVNSLGPLAPQASEETSHHSRPYGKGALAGNLWAVKATNGEVLAAVHAFPVSGDTGDGRNTGPAAVCVDLP